MHWPIDFDNSALTLAIALAAGMLAQALARHVRLPGIVLLVAAGVLLGPDGANVVRPGLLQDLLPMLVGFAVAVILFDGGMNLDIRRLRRSAPVIQRLITVGALVTWLGGSLAARWIMGWSWPLSILFGSLVIVTGPTVINPLLRRLRVKKRVGTILEAEGVLIDAIGAIIAVVALEVAFHAQTGIGQGIWELLVRLLFGSLVGVAFGFAVAGLMRLHKLIPEGLENMLILALVLVVFQFSDALLSESGIVTVTLAGLVVGNIKTRALGSLRDFKEELATLLIGMLFVVLAADVRLAEIGELGWRGAATVAALMFIVRPLNIAVSAGKSLSSRERLFLSWMAPRGIVAAAVASLFAQELEEMGVEGAAQLRALVFLVIAATVLIQGLTGAPLARVLGLRRPSDSGYAILGANTLGLELGRLLRSSEHEVVFLDSNPEASRRAEEAGFRVIFGNALQEGILYRAQLDSRAGCVALTANEEVNFIFARHAREEFKAPRLWVALRRGARTVLPGMIDLLDARVLFGAPRTIDLWALRLDKGEATIEDWTASVDPDPLDRRDTDDGRDPRDLLLPLAYRRDAVGHLVDDRSRLKAGDVLSVAVLERRRTEAEEWLRLGGFEPATESEAVV